MSFLDVVTLALIEGLGEVLPVGASGHLALLPALGGTRAARTTILAAADLGILLALALYFWRDLAAMAAGLWRLAKGRPDPGTRLLMLVAVGTVPALGLGWLFLDLGGGFGGARGAAAAMLVFGLFLLVADRLGMTVARVEHMNLTTAFAIGVLQAAALVPGVSRTGITITAARLMGYERQAASRFSLLLAMPALVAHLIRTLWALPPGTLALSAEQGLAELGLAELGLAAAIAGLAAVVAVAAMMAWVRTNSFAPFALWRILFGAALVTLGML